MCNILVFCFILTTLCNSFFFGFPKPRPFPKKRVTKRPTKRPTRPNGNDFDFGHSVCQGERDLWDPPSIPLSQRNQIGRAIYQTPKKVKKATKLIKKGQIYPLSYEYSANAPLGFGRFLETSALCFQFPELFFGGCQTSINSNAIGNIGTQFDYFPHFAIIDSRANTSEPIKKSDIYFFNNFKGSDLFDNRDFSNASGGVTFLGIENLPIIYTKAILLDIPAAKGWDVLPNSYQITLQDFKDTLTFQGLTVNSIEKGDVVLVYTGFGRFFFNSTIYANEAETPQVSIDIFKEILIPNGVMLFGSDAWLFDSFPFPIHQLWLVCHGGLIHESVNLDEWVSDIRKKKAPYIGAYVFQPLPLKGAVASGGRPNVFV